MGGLFAAHSTARADGLIVVPNPPSVVRGHFSFAPLEVVYHRVECDIQDQVAVTSVDQEFFNPNSARLEGEYIFPVPKGAQINKFSMDIDGKQVEAELLPAEKARQIYTEIVAKTKDPALLEYAGRAMFKVRIFPIEPNSRKQIKLKYTELLKQDNGLLDYHYTLNTEKFSAKPLKNVSVKVTVNSADPLTTLYSPTHEVEVKRKGDTSATVGFEAKDIRPDTDFHLYIGRKQAPLGINLLTYRPDSSKEGYFVLMASPTVSKDVKALPKDVVFVMDTSGSMAGEKIEQARKALKYCIDTLNPDDRFDVVRFSTEAEPLFDGVKAASAENRAKAQEFVASFRAAGGTAIDEALAKARSELGRTAGQPRLSMTVFMTDGQPTVGETNPDAIIKKNVKDAAGGVRIFSFGVGHDVNTKLLDLVAEGSHGYSQYVLPNENLELSMSNFWGKVQDPVLAGLKLDAGDFRLSSVYPNELPDLFKGDQLVVFGTYTKAGKGAVTLTGTAGTTEQKFAQDVTFEEKTDSSKEWIAKLWATRRVGYLLDEIRLRGESKELRDEVVELARKWGVVTPYTAMLIIEDERTRGVPLAQRSMREMEFDRQAGSNSFEALGTLRDRRDNGREAVANSINSNAYKSVTSMDASDRLARQEEARTQFDANGPALAKGAAAPSAQPGSATIAGGWSYGVGGGGGGTAGGGRGGRGAFGGATAAERPNTVAVAPEAVQRAGLNLGAQSANGWQTLDKDASARDAGYRVITNYAQQSRVINNRNFFLNGNQWTDAQVQGIKNAKPVKITFGSKEYFDLLTKYPDAAQYLALGNNITLELGGTVYDIVEESPPQ
jgi:Ca-activated chloride channel family protein